MKRDGLDWATTGCVVLAVFWLGGILQCQSNKRVRAEELNVCAASYAELVQNGWSSVGGTVEGLTYIRGGSCLCCLDPHSAPIPCSLQLRNKLGVKPSKLPEG